MSQIKLMQSPSTTASRYSEITIDKTVYRVTRIYLGQKDLKKTLEQLTIKRIYDEMTSERALNAYED